jgi:hypothetical protein
MTPAQYMKFVADALASNFLAEDTYYQRKQGLMSDTAYDVWLSSLRRGILTLPGVRAHWPIARHMFSDEFVEFFNKLIADTQPTAPNMQSSFASWKARTAAEIDRATALQQSAQIRPV